MKHKAVFATVAAAAVMVATSAFAAPNVVVTKDTYLYKNSSGNNVVGEVDEGEELEVTSCGAKRCKVKLPGPDPYIRKDRIEPLDDDDDDDSPNVQLNLDLGNGVSIGIGNNGVNVGIGGGSGPTSGPRACFFQHAGYGGASFCVAVGKSINNLSVNGFNDTISSIRLYGGADVQVCEHAGFNGACTTYGSNKSGLGGFNDIISSVEVY